MTTNTINYKPLEIQNSVSNEYKKQNKHIVEPANFDVFLESNSHSYAFDYLGGGNVIGKGIRKSRLDSNPLSFKNTLKQEQLLTSKATSQMQDFLNTPNLTNFEKNRVSLNNNNFKNAFEGYSIDEYGFMGEEFLKAANLPNEYKIHKNVLQAFNDFYTISIHSNYKTIDLIAGISAANKEFNTLLKEDKEYYTKEEIIQSTKASKGAFNEEDFEALLMQDYKNEKGEFKKEGIMLMYAVNSGALEDTPLSLYDKKENKKSQNNFTMTNNSKEKTSQEKAKEMKDALNDYYLKALESSQEGIQYKDDNVAIPNRMIKESQEFKDKVTQLEFYQRSGKPKEVTGK